MHAPHHVAARVGRAVPRPLRPRLGAVARPTCSPRQLAPGVVPAGHRARANGRRWIDEWDVARRRRRTRCSRAMHGGVRRVPLAHRRADRPPARLSSTRSASSTTRSSCSISDNGASGEGGPHGTFNEHRFTEHVARHRRGQPRVDRRARRPALATTHYSWGWAWAGNTPLRLWKRYTWLGGTRTPLIVHWPAGIDATRGEVRDQFVHAIDLMPTVLDAAGVDAPDVGRRRRAAAVRRRQPARPPSPTPARRRPRSTQYFEMLGTALDRRSTVGRPPPTTCRRASSTRSACSRAAASFADDRWAPVPPRRRLRRDARPRRRRARRLAELQALVGRGRPQPGAPPRRHVHRSRRRARAEPVAARVLGHVPTRWGTGGRGHARADGRRASPCSRT